MADKTEELETPQEKSEEPKKGVPSNEELIETLVKARLATALKEIKSKLDNAYSARDEALKKIAEFEQKEKDAELARLKEEGKHKEAFEMQLAEERARRETLEKRNIELTRDIEVRNVLSAYPFRNDTALGMAYREITGQLVQDENGIWKHNSGVSIRDYAKAFAESEANEFLFKPKVNSGSGSQPTRTDASSTTSKSLFDMSQDEVLKLAAEGKLRK